MVLYWYGSWIEVGFWGVSGSLLCKRAWKHAYFKLLDNIKDRIFGGKNAKIELAMLPFKKIPHQ